MVDSSISTKEFITPLEPWNLENSSGAVNLSEDSSEVTVPFQEVFNQAIEDVKATQTEVEEDQYLLATGQLEDPHTLPIAQSKAQISLDLLISLRNKAVESYNELLKMSL